MQLAGAVKANFNPNQPRVPAIPMAVNGPMQAVEVVIVSNRQAAPAVQTKAHR